MCIFSNFHMVCRNISRLKHCSFAFFILLHAHWFPFISRHITFFKSAVNSTDDVMILFVCPTLSLVKLYSEMYRHQFCNLLCFSSWCNTPYVIFHSVRIFKRFTFWMSYLCSTFDFVSGFCSFYHLFCKCHSIFIIKALVINQNCYLFCCPSWHIFT